MSYRRHKIFHQKYNFYIEIKHYRHGMARPQVADGGDALLEGSCEYVE
jgi:hypothetical protein